MEAVNGVSELDKGGPPAPSPLTGCYLLIVVGEPHSKEHKDIILQRIAKGLLSWDASNCHVDLEKELAIISEQAPEGEDARYGERLIQFASENLVTEVLIHPAISTLSQCMKNLLSSFTRHRHIIHAGYTFAGNGSWILQDGTFSLIDFSEAFQEVEVQRVLRAYDNTISLDIHCSPEGDWTRLPKEPFTRNSKVRVNPDDVLTSGSPAIVNFLNYISPFLIPTDIEMLLESSDVVGNIRFSHPTLYVFPGGQGDAALFGINGFNMLVDGGFGRKACFWDFVRHLDRLDAVLLTRLNNSNVSGISSVLRRKRHNTVYPQIGHFFCNIQERKAILSPDGDKDKDTLLINLFEEGQDIMNNLRQLHLQPQPCYRDVMPMNLYHKVGHGTLDMYVLSPARDSKEVKEFLQKWNSNDQRLFANQKNGKEFIFPTYNLVSICALLVWQPANMNDNITRILFPGSSPQHKIFEGLDKLKQLECIKHPSCSTKTLTSTIIKSKLTKTEKIIQDKEIKTKPVFDSKPKIENKVVEENIKNGHTNGISNNQTISEKIIKKHDSTESEKSGPPLNDTKKPEVTRELINGKSVEEKIVDKAKLKSKPEPKIKPETKPSKTGRSLERKPKPPAEKKASPTTPKKMVEIKMNGDSAKLRAAAKTSPSATPAKSAKDANNRKVVESKIKSAPKKEVSKPSERKDTKIERKPISRRPKGTSPVGKVPESPIKKISELHKIETRKPKLEKECTTDSSTVSTPSADVETTTKKDLSKLTPEEIEQLKDRELAELKEEQEVVKEIEAVFRKSESKTTDDSDMRKIKNISIDDKTEGDGEEYLIIEKEEIDHDSLDEKDVKESETQKHLRDSEESEKQRKLSDVIESVDVKEKEIEDMKPEKLEEQELLITVSKDEKETPKAISKDVSVTTPDDKIEESSGKKVTDREVEEEIKDINILESQPDEKFSTPIESGATTAPTLPEDERIPLDEIKEDNGDLVIEEKYVKEDTKEKDIPIVQLPPKAVESVAKIPTVVGIRLDKQTPMRDIVKTPDEVADLPVHEEVDIENYEQYQVTQTQASKQSDLKLPLAKAKTDDTQHEVNVPEDQGDIPDNENITVVPELSTSKISVENKLAEKDKKLSEKEEKIEEKEKEIEKIEILDESVEEKIDEKEKETKKFEEEKLEIQKLEEKEEKIEEKIEAKETKQIKEEEKEVQKVEEKEKKIEEKIEEKDTIQIEEEEKGIQKVEEKEKETEVKIEEKRTEQIEEQEKEIQTVEEKEKKTEEKIEEKDTNQIKEEEKEIQKIEEKEKKIEEKIEEDGTKQIEEEEKEIQIVEEKEKKIEEKIAQKETKNYEEEVKETAKVDDKEAKIEEKGAAIIIEKEETTERKAEEADVIKDKMDDVKEKEQKHEKIEGKEVIAEKTEEVEKIEETKEQIKIEEDVVKDKKEKIEEKEKEVKKKDEQVTEKAVEIEEIKQKDEEIEEKEDKAEKEIEQIEEVKEKIQDKGEKEIEQIEKIKEKTQTEDKQEAIEEKEDKIKEVEAELEKTESIREKVEKIIVEKEEIGQKVQLPQELPILDRVTIAGKSEKVDELQEEKETISKSLKKFEIDSTETKHDEVQTNKENKEKSDMEKNILAKESELVAVITDKQEEEKLDKEKVTSLNEEIKDAENIIMQEQVQEAIVEKQTVEDNMKEIVSTEEVKNELSDTIAQTLKEKIDKENDNQSKDDQFPSESHKIEVLVERTEVKIEKVHTSKDDLPFSKEGTKEDEKDKDTTEELKFDLEQVEEIQLAEKVQLIEAQELIKEVKQDIRELEKELIPSIDDEHIGKDAIADVLHVAEEMVDSVYKSLENDIQDIVQESVKTIELEKELDSKKKEIDEAELKKIEESIKPDEQEKEQVLASTAKEVVTAQIETVTEKGELEHKQIDEMCSNKIQPDQHKSELEDSKLDETTVSVQLADKPTEMKLEKEREDIEENIEVKPNESITNQSKDDDPTLSNARGAEEDTSDDKASIQSFRHDSIEISKIDKKLQELKESETKTIMKVEPTLIKSELELVDKLELGRKSPKEREQDVAKIVASVAEVLKSDAPLEEFEGKIPLEVGTFNTFPPYTTELRETHITTVESPIRDVIVESILMDPIEEEKLPFDSTAVFINEEKKIAEKHVDYDCLANTKESSRVSSLLKDSNELIQATSKMISDIKQSAKTEEVETSVTADKKEIDSKEAEPISKIHHSPTVSGKTSPDRKPEIANNLICNEDDLLEAQTTESKITKESMDRINDLDKSDVKYKPTEDNQDKTEIKSGDIEQSKKAIIEEDLKAEITHKIKDTIDISSKSTSPDVLEDLSVGQSSEVVEIKSEIPILDQIESAWATVTSQLDVQPEIANGDKSPIKKIATPPVIETKEAVATETAEILDNASINILKHTREEPTSETTEASRKTSSVNFEKENVEEKEHPKDDFSADSEKPIAKTPPSGTLISSGKASPELIDKDGITVDEGFMSTESVLSVEEIQAVEKKDTPSSKLDEEDKSEKPMGESIELTEAKPDSSKLLPTDIDKVATDKESAVFSDGEKSSTELKELGVADSAEKHIPADKSSTILRTSTPDVKEMQAKEKSHHLSGDASPEQSYEPVQLSAISKDADVKVVEDQERVGDSKVEIKDKSPISSRTHSPSLLDQEKDVVAENAIEHKDIVESIEKVVTDQGIKQNDAKLPPELKDLDSTGKLSPVLLQEKEVAVKQETVKETKGEIVHITGVSDKLIDTNVEQIKDKLDSVTDKSAVLCSEKEPITEKVVEIVEKDDSRSSEKTSPVLSTEVKPTITEKIDILENLVDSNKISENIIQSKIDSEIISPQKASKEDDKILDALESETISKTSSAVKEDESVTAPKSSADIPHEAATITLPEDSTVSLQTEQKTENNLIEAEESIPKEGGLSSKSGKSSPEVDEAAIRETSEVSSGKVSPDVTVKEILVAEKSITPLESKSPIRSGKTSPVIILENNESSSPVPLDSVSISIAKHERVEAKQLDTSHEISVSGRSSPEISELTKDLLDTKKSPIISRKSTPEIIVDNDFVVSDRLSPEIDIETERKSSFIDEKDSKTESETEHISESVIPVNKSSTEEDVVESDNVTQRSSQVETKKVDAKIENTLSSVVLSESPKTESPTTIIDQAGTSGADTSCEPSISRKSIPDIITLTKDNEVVELITGRSTPPTAPVSPICKEKPASAQDKLVSEKKDADTPISKTTDVRSITPASDDCDISSGQVSRVLTTEDDDGKQVYSDEEDIPGSPLSATSQVAHSTSSQYDFEDSVRGVAVLDPMSTSFYGALPDDPVDLGKETKLAHIDEKLYDSSHSSPSHIYEITTARFSNIHLREELQKEEHSIKPETDIMTASFIGAELPSDSKEDPIASWGKPLGLPSPAPLNDNKGTPKKEKKILTNVMFKNRLNEDKKGKKINPVYVDLTYVPHNGNSNYSYVDFFKRVRARYYVFSGIEPSKEVYSALLEAKQTWDDKDLEVTIIPTYDTDVLGYWVAENEDLLAKYKIDLSPSASRCTINLQDHETSCSAYRLEFS